MAVGLDEERLREHKRRNLVHTALLLGGIGGLLAVAAYLIFGAMGIAITLIAAGVIVVASPRVPPEVVMKLYRAQRVPHERGGQIAVVLAEIAERAGLARLPTLHVIPSMTLNAFATGTPDHAAIAVTEGLLRRLTIREIAGVLAHEISHVRNNDLAVMGLADVLSRLTLALYYAGLALIVVNLPGVLLGDVAVSWWAVLALLAAPALSNLLQLGLSRAREYDADLEAAMLTGDPLGLASALRRLEAYTGQVWEDMLPPVPARRVPAPSVLRTHPDTASRVERLVALQGRPSLPQIIVVEEPVISSLAGWGPIEMRPRYRFPGLWY